VSIVIELMIDVRSAISQQQLGFLFRMHYNYLLLYAIYMYRMSYTEWPRK